MNTIFKAIQKSFDLLDQQPTVNQSAYMKALEYMLKIADKVDHKVNECTIHTDKDGSIIININGKNTNLCIQANDNGISYEGTGPHKDDKIRVINSNSYYVNDKVIEWLKRNRKK